VPILDPDRKKEVEQVAALDSNAIRAQLEKILASGSFQRSRRYPSLLRHVVEHSLNGFSEGLKERTLGIAVFKRDPDYDTSADPIVRTTASEIRKRLEEYYSDPNHSSELRIVLPVGAYTPEFRLAANDRAPAVPLWRRRGIQAVAALAIIAAGLGVTAGILLGSNDLHRFWAPMFEADEVVVVIGTLMAPAKPAAEQPAPEMRELLDPKVLLSLNAMTSKIAAYFGANGKTMDYQMAGDVTVAKLRAHPFILHGAFNNPLTLQAVSGFRYFLHMDRASRTRQIVDRQDPSRHWDCPMDDPSRDYALVARAPDPRTGQLMVVVAGLGSQGTAAATEFLTNPKYMARVAAQAPGGWARRNLEIVLETELANGEWGEPHIVTTYFW
jgi:hypothetical protein